MTRPKQDIHPLIVSQVANAKLLAIQIEAAAKRLAQLMDQLHGREFKFMVSHEDGGEMVMIAHGLKRGGSSRG